MDHVRLEDLLNRHVDGALAGEERRELERMLLDSPDARGAFWRFVRLHNLIRDNFHSQTGRRVAAEAVPPIVVISDVGPSGGAWQGAIGWLSQTGPLSYMVAAAIVGMMLLGAWAYKITHYQQIAEAPAPPSSERPALVFVGRITGMVDCRWADPKTEAYLGASVPLGRKYALSAGLMEITYRSGARVILEGPCTYKVESDAGGYLAMGRLTARIEKRRGKREEREISQAANLSSFILHPSSFFTVRTPTAIVTDLGTEFGVEVSENGDTTSHVFRGFVKVEVIGDARKQEVTLHENESARVIKDKNGDGLNLVRLNVSETLPKFARQMADPPDTLAEEAYIRAVLADKPLGYWPLNESANSRRFSDRSGNGFHGTAMGVVRAGQSGPLPGQSRAVALDGRGYIDLGRQDRFAMANGFTVEAWVWIEGPTARSGRVISAASGDGPHQHSGWGLGYIGNPQPRSDGKQPFYYFTCYDVASEWSVEAPRARWTHLAYVFDSDNSGRLYLNGELRAEYPAGPPANIGPVWVAIGWGANNNGEYWRGRLAHVAVYGSVLSQRQIQNHFLCTHVPEKGSQRHETHQTLEPSTSLNPKEGLPMQQ